MLLSYLKRHVKTILLFALFVLVFALVFSLYHLEAEAVFYAALLCACLGFFAFGIGFWRYVRRHRQLMEVLDRLNLGIDRLPQPSDRLEADYQTILQQLYARGLHDRSQADNQRRDMEDYYTLWAHQIKTPLAAMRLLLSEGGGQNNSLLLAELFKTEQYVEMVLQYIRLRSESSDILLQTCSLDELIKGCLRKYARLFALKNLEFSFRETGLKVLTDQKWLSFAIEQVFSNSLKYTPSGKISIYAEDSYLVIEDTGIGIRAEDLPRVCEKGYTGAGGRSDKKSTGIGLFLCKGILIKLGHSFTIDSEVGRGTRVKIGLQREITTFE
ncbi:MAG: sensor histidine kinase [Clostridiales bacterium]